MANTKPTSKATWDKHKVWEKPLYPFRIRNGLDYEERCTFKEIYIDVTDSAPSFESPKESLSRVFGEILQEFGNKKLTVLDFGAGKLRNSIFFLQEGHTVHAVEFESLRNSEQAKRLMGQVDNYSKNFKQFLFPDEFLKTKEKFDLILLVNVLTIMPVPAERWLVLLHCHERLKKDGSILYYAQFGDRDSRSRCTEENIISDGWYVGIKKRFKTFFREYKDQELKDIFLACGLDHHKTMQVPGNKCLVFKKRKNAPFKRILDAELIEKANIIDPMMPTPKENTPRIVTHGVSSDVFDGGEFKEYIASPDCLSFETLLLNVLKTIKPGANGSDPNDFETIIALLLSRIFKGGLKNLKLQEEINEGRRRVDFVMTNDAKDGFFWHLSERHNFKCPYILFECKNYSEDLKNPEFDQLIGRLQRRIGDVGIIVCRSIKDKAKCLKAQQDRFPDKLILVFDDEDIICLINFHLNEDRDGLLNFLDDKAKAVIFSK